MTFTVKQVCEHFGVSEATCLGWIARGELKSINVGRSPNKQKKRYRITQEALDAFAESRAVTPPAPRTRRRKKSNDDVIEFIK
jgi:excisionase family DNA binding protein